MYTTRLTCSWVQSSVHGPLNYVNRNIGSAVSATIVELISYIAVMQFQLRVHQWTCPLNASERGVAGSGRFFLKKWWEKGGWPKKNQIGGGIGGR